MQRWERGTKSRSFFTDPRSSGGAFQLGAAWYNNDAASLFFFFPPSRYERVAWKGRGWWNFSRFKEIEIKGFSPCEFSRKWDSWEGGEREFLFPRFLSLYFWRFREVKLKLVDKKLALINFSIFLHLLNIFYLKIWGIKITLITFLILYEN